MQSPRAFGAARNEKLRAVVRDMIDREFEGNMTAAARALKVSPAAVHDFLGGNRGAGMKLLDGIVAHTGRSIDELVSGREKPGSLRMHPEWKDRLAEARDTRKGKSLPSWAFEAAADTFGGRTPEHLTVEFIVGLADFWFTHASDDALERETTEEAKRDLERARKAKR